MTPVERHGLRLILGWRPPDSEMSYAFLTSYVAEGHRWLQRQEIGVRELHCLFRAYLAAKRT